MNERSVARYCPDCVSSGLLQSTRIDPILAADYIPRHAPVLHMSMMPTPAFEVMDHRLCERSSMKILRLTLYIGPTNEAYNQFTLPELSRHQVTMCTVFPGELQPDARLDYHEGDGRIVRFLVRLWLLLRHQPPDVVHIHSPHLCVMFLIAALLARPTLLRRTLLHVHSSYPVYRFRNRWMLLPGFLFFGRIICCGHASRSSFPAWWQRLAGRRLRTICNAVDLDRVDVARTELAGQIRLQGPHVSPGARASHPLPIQQRRAAWGSEHDSVPRVASVAADVRGEPCSPNVELDRPVRLGERHEFRLVTVGHLRPLKNQMTVVRALSETTGDATRLTIVGGGRMLQPLRDEAERLGVADRVVFTGQISRDATLRQLWNADGFVSMSRGEGMPVSVLEAMSCHCPVILSRIPPHLELADAAGDRVLLVDADDATRLARCIDRLASLDPATCAAWGKACRQAVEASFSLQRMHRQCEQLFQTLLVQRRAGGKSVTV